MKANWHLSSEGKGYGFMNAFNHGDDQILRGGHQRSDPRGVKVSRNYSDESWSLWGEWSSKREQQVRRPIGGKSLSSLRNWKQDSVFRARGTRGQWFGMRWEGWIKPVHPMTDRPTMGGHVNRLKHFKKDYDTIRFLILKKDVRSERRIEYSLIIRKYIHFEKFGVCGSLAHYHIIYHIILFCTLEGVCLTQQMSTLREGFFSLISFYTLAPNTQCLGYIGDR